MVLCSEQELSVVFSGFFFYPAQLEGGQRDSSQQRILGVESPDKSTFDCSHNMFRQSSGHLRLAMLHCQGLDHQNF